MLFSLYTLPNRVHKEGIKMDKEKKEFGRWWMWILGLLVVTTIVTTALNYAGIIGRTVVERKVFENSYQYNEGQRARISIFEAQLAEIERKLVNRELDETTRANLEAQSSSVRIQLGAARRSER